MHSQKADIISIPYGAIKSNFLKTFEQPFQEFQFLMVRLKVAFLTITSDKASTFQFLMVRLKVKFNFRTRIKFFISIPYGAIKSIMRL